MPVPSTQPAAERKLLRDTVQDKIRDAIMDGTLEPGERLNDDDLIAWLGVSRTPIREALAELARAGLIEMAPNRYTRVTTPNPSGTMSRPITASIATMPWTATKYYALVAEPFGAYDERYGYQSDADYQQLAAAMASSPYWHRVWSSGTTAWCSISRTRWNRCGSASPHGRVRSRTARSGRWPATSSRPASCEVPHRRT
ncbi:GntR family transcriptional regulator, partial [Bacillus sp. S34]|nr:GntR family transcriptional regulator [Bacillus sp. S34]